MTLVYIELLVVVGLERFMDAEKLTLEKCKSELCNFVWGVFHFKNTFVKFDSLKWTGHDKLERLSMKIFLMFSLW